MPDFSAIMDIDREKLSQQSGTWHYGLLARWWAEFNKAEPHELAYYRAAIQRVGEPVVDLGCGTGRLLVPLVAEGFDVDGVDISADMVAAAREQLRQSILKSKVHVQGLHRLRLSRSHGTAYLCGVLGIGGSRERDREALRRIHNHLRPGGALLIVHVLPYNSGGRWSDWLPGNRAEYPKPWPAEGNRKPSADGDEIELLTRVTEFDPLEQQMVLGMRARLWRDGAIVREEAYALKSCLYFAQEILWMLSGVGFREVAIEGNYTGQPATGDDGTVIFVARK